MENDQDIKIDKKIDLAKTKLIYIDNYLHAYMRKSNLRQHHFAGLKAHARGMKFATKEAWDKLFSTY